jgi:hypothetical protein
LSGTFGGWVSENYLAYGRLLKYLSCLTEQLPATDAPYKDPNLSPEEMLLPHLKMWCRVRGIKVQKAVGQQSAKKADYFRAVHSTGWRKPGDEPTVPVNHTTSINLALFSNTVVSCHSMVARIMGVKGLLADTQRLQIRRAVKLYLSFDHIFLAGEHAPDGRTGAEVIHPPPAPDLSIRLTCPVDTATPLGPATEDSDDSTMDDDASLSDDSVDDLADEHNTPDDRGALPPVSGVRRGNIPAVKKRNKLNLLMVDSLLSTFGSYQYLSELGPKGEGAIQTVKPIVKKYGGLNQKDWPLFVGRAWFSRRFSKSIISMAVDALRFLVESGPDTSGKATCSSEDRAFFRAVTQTFTEFLHTPGPDTPPSDDVVDFFEEGDDEIPAEPPGGIDNESIGDSITVICEGEAPPAKRMFIVYPSKQKFLDTMEDPTCPISVLVLMPEKGSSKIWFAGAYKNEDSLVCLMQVFPSHHVAESFGAAFFQWRVRSPPVTRPLASARISDYAILLPLNATLAGASITVYHCVTYGWMELLQNGTLGQYRLDAANIARF